MCKKNLTVHMSRLSDNIDLKNEKKKLRRDEFKNYQKKKNKIVFVVFYNG